jgi:hypothetical protein
MCFFCKKEIVGLAPPLPTNIYFILIISKLENSCWEKNGKRVEIQGKM